MLGKLAFRNMKRSARDYLVYILTMTMVAALMYAFNSLIFQNDLAEFFDVQDMMAWMLGLATVFIVLIVAWLINYMVRFMLEKRSSEFGIYLLLGMKKKVISRLYMRENILLGSAAFLMGIAAGILLRQVLMAVMFSMVRMEYQLQVTFNIGTILMTVVCYGGCYMLALFRCKRKFRKMNIHALMNAKRQNEEIREKYEETKRFLLPLSVLLIFAFWSIFGGISKTEELVVFLIALVFSIYLFYIGLSAWITCYIRKKGNKIYEGQNLFLLRQFASKVRIMQFTMGTLTALFTLALMGASVALMFSEYENTVLEGRFPFDVQVYSSDVNDDFGDEIEVISSSAKPLEYYKYCIYTDGNDQVNTWMLLHLNTWGAMFKNGDGSPNIPGIKDFLARYNVYYTYDTYMGLSDYNHLRQMLGYDYIELGQHEYAVQIKSRLRKEVQDIEKGLYIPDSSGREILSLKEIYSDPFSQDGHNGTDYLIVVPDEVLERMEPYYSELVVDLEGTPTDLQRNLSALANDNSIASIGDYVGPIPENRRRQGSDNLINYAVDILVRDNLMVEIKYMLAGIIIPLFYIGLVFVCVAVTVLSVQQLSDSAKYKFRYDVLAKLGLERSRIRHLIGKQLAAYYLCPAILAMVISGKMILFISSRFVSMTGVPASVGGFFTRSIVLFFGIYLVYFVVTYVGFIRNVEN